MGGAMVGFSCGVDPRLERRYWKLVAEHSAALKPLAAGLRALPGTGKAFASTQAMWRFLKNDRMKRTTLVQPLWNYAQEYLQAERPEFVLVVHDWSQLHFRKHQDKEDRIDLPCDWNQGYELLTALLVSARDGQPIAPVVQALEAADGVHGTYSARLQPAQSHMDALRPMMRAAEKAALGVRCVHVIDREGNAVYYLRQWAKQKRLFVVRSDYSRIVRHEGEEHNLRSVAQLLARRSVFRYVRDVSYHGRRATQEVAETTVVLDRPAYQQRPKHGRKPHVRIRGQPLALRLVVSRVFDEKHRLLAEWYLLTNVPDSVDDATVALWYYWRWRIESYFKLLKSAGLQLEEWQQTTAERILRRLLIAGMACVTVWQLAGDSSPAAVEARSLLIRLSGRQMKRKRPFTEPALLAGLWVLLAMLDVLDHYTIADLRRAASICFPALKQIGFV
jgi:hypothetical protein